MKAALEEARLLEAAGRRDEALALLRTDPRDPRRGEPHRSARSSAARPDGARRGAVRSPPARRRSWSPDGPRARDARRTTPFAGRRRVPAPLPDVPTGCFDPLLGAAPHDATTPSTRRTRSSSPRPASCSSPCSMSPAPAFSRGPTWARPSSARADALLVRASAPADPLPTLAAWGSATAVSAHRRDAMDALRRPAQRSRRRSKASRARSAGTSSSLPELPETAALASRGLRCRCTRC